ncbi:MAG: hypothetical protein ACI9G1_004815, partial [Pirellulaceae bacterium]
MQNIKFYPSRRAILQGLGVSLALPWFESLAPAATRDKTPPAKMLYLYVPNGVNVNTWLPPIRQQLSPTLQPLARFQDKFTVLEGLGHPNSQGGHTGADTWLTAADLAGVPGFDYRNQISADQVAAEALGKVTRFPSLELSSRSGSGIPGHSNTLAFNRHGIPLPAQNQPRDLFHRLFAPDQYGSRESRSNRIDEKLSIIDAVLDNANDVQRRLSHDDRRKMSEYLESVREIERRVKRDQDWLSVPKPRVDPQQFQLDQRPDYTRAYYRLMYDLIVLALQTDSTRVITFQIGREAAGGRFT